MPDEPLAADLFCPYCAKRHVDRDEWATRAHHTHLCAFCGGKWRVEPYCVGKEATPELVDFVSAVPSEAAFQREKWGSEHDAGKTPADWFWLVGYLAGKALHCHAEGKTEKALHHTITAAAALANWHSAILGKTNMRPGIEPPAPENP